MIFETMPKSRYLKSFGIVIVLMAICCMLWRNGGTVSGKSGVASGGLISSAEGDSLPHKQDIGSTRRLTREVNVESRVRSLLQIASGEVGNIRIPSSGFGLLLSEEQEKKLEDIPLIPISREQAVQGLEEILRNGDSLGSRIDISNGKITWEGDGIAINGEVNELKDDFRNLHIVIESTAGNGLFRKAEVATGIQGYSFFLVRAPDPGAGGVLLVFGEPLNDSKIDQ